MFDHENMAPLHACAKDGRSEVAMVLGKDEKFINLTDPKFNMTPLHICALYGQADVAKVLITKHDIRKSALDFNKNSPLHLSAYYGHLEISKLLLEHETDIKIRNNGTHGYGKSPDDYMANTKTTDQSKCYTPYDFAVMTERDDIIKLMKENAKGTCIVEENRNSFRIGSAVTYN